MLSRRTSVLPNEDGGYLWEYSCVRCVMLANGLENEGEARHIMYESNGVLDYKKARTAIFQSSQDNIRSTYEALGIVAGKHQIYHLARGFMTTLFSEMSSMILLKRDQMRASAKDHAACQALIEELRTCTDPQRVVILVAAIDKQMEVDGIQQLSFGGSAEHLNASAYADEWVSCRDGHFRHYFLCCAGGSQYPCHVMMTSKSWEQRYPGEAWHKGQRWYCSPNKHRYYGKFGVIVEIRKGAEIFYLRAECPDQEVLDARALLHEKQYGKKLTPAELYAKIPIVPPTLTSLVEEVDAAKGEYHWTSPAALTTMPFFKWDDIFTFADEA